MVKVGVVFDKKNACVRREEKICTDTSKNNIVIQKLSCRGRKKMGVKLRCKLGNIMRKNGKIVLNNGITLLMLVLTGVKAYGNVFRRCARSTSAREQKKKWMGK